MTREKPSSEGIAIALIASGKPFGRSYTSEGRRCIVARMFFGVGIPDDIRQLVADAAGNLQQAGIVADNWSDPSLYHLTVLFLGEISEARLDVVQQAGVQAASCVSPFALRLTDVGAFARNRILWVGVEENEGLTALATMHADLNRTLAEQGVMQPDTRPYRAHLTLARKLKTSSEGDVLRATEIGRTKLKDAEFPVQDLLLFESTRIDGRLAYPVRERYPL